VRFFRDPISALRAAQDLGRPVLALAYPLPVRGRRILHVLALGPESNRAVLGDSALYRTTGQGIGGPRGSSQRRLRSGLTRSQRKKHQWQRKLVMPAFQRPAVERGVPVLVASVDRVLDAWAPGETRDLWREMRSLTLRMASDALFVREDPERSYALGEMVGEWLERGFSPGVWMFPVDAPGTPYRALLRHAERIEREVRELIAEKRLHAAQRDDVLSLLVRAHAEGHPWMSDDDLVGQTTVMFGASYETTATAMTWLLFLLAQHPAVARDLADEIEGELHGAAPDAAALARLPLADAVIRESMRVLPSVPYTIRVATGDAALGDVRIARGDRVIVSHFLTHHQPDLYPEPRRFRPERWSEIRRGPYEYLPFGAGPRLCIGKSFAETAMKTALVRLCQRFRWSVVPGTRIDRTVRVAMAPRGPLPIALHLPDRGFATVPVRGDVLELVELPSPAGSAL
jgi:cytochrome P450